jgi:hypothetical protein
VKVTVIALVGCSLCGLTETTLSTGGGVGLVAPDAAPELPLLECPPQLATSNATAASATVADDVDRVSRTAASVAPVNYSLTLRRLQGRSRFTDVVPGSPL